ncbi:MAG: response regulator [Bryobacteraceae bacterium]|jgi:CheY-like chemotaxis protein
MSRILLVDDSPHAQRMGERILAEEGYEVVTVSNADSALIRLEDVDPDVVLADTVMPGRTGYEICQYLKMSPRHRHVRVILTAGVLEPLDDGQVKRVEADGTLRKPFEATALLAAVKPLAEAAAAARIASDASKGPRALDKAPGTAQAAPFVAVVDSEQVKAAVTVALDASMDAIVEQISLHVLQALQTGKPEPERPAEAARPAAASPPAPALRAVEPPPAAPRAQTVRRVTPFRLRSGSILGLDIVRPDPEIRDARSEEAVPDPEPEGAPPGAGPLPPT